MSNDFDDATQLGSIGHNPSVPSQPGQQQPAFHTPNLPEQPQAVNTRRLPPGRCAGQGLAALRRGRAA